ncbi:TonB-dependent receptor [Sphingomonas oligophenolica]|uniref:TonB-dependent receptor n=1 Tax=Sphingomonas oligophenolica TaxID=301154 RepID=A0ABU9Y0V0_9SPHN
MTSIASLRAGCALFVLAFGGFAAQMAWAETIRGRIVDDAKRTALPGATIRISATGATATAAADGSFSIDGMPAGTQHVTIDYVGYDTKAIDLEASADPAAMDIGLTSAVAAADIVVTGNRLAERRALQTKKSADNVVEALYANDVGKLPDQNVAEAVRRLPGLSVANDQGEGRYVIIRGIDPNLINVTLNNQTLPAPEPGGRVVKLDDIPSSLIAAVVVTKSLVASQDANAVGGAVDIRTVSAFDRNKSFFLDGRGAAGYYKLNGKTPYELDGQVGGIFGQFGAVVSVNYSSRPIESENFQGSTNYVAQPNGSLVPDQNGLRDYNLVRTRLGVVGNFDWRPNDDVKIYLRSSYSKFTDHETRDQNRLGSETNITTTGATTGTFNAVGTVLVRRREEDDNTKSITLGGAFNLGGGTLEASGGWTKAVKTDPIRSEYTFSTARGISSKAPVAVSYDLSTEPVYSFTDTAGAFSDGSRFGLTKYNLETRQAFEELWQGRVDYTLPIGLGDDSSIKVGAKYLDRHKFNNQDKLNYKQGSVAWGLNTVSRTGDTGFYDGMFGFGERIDYNAARAYADAHPGVIAIDTGSTVSDTLSSDYDVHESISAGYAMATLKFGGLTLVPGIRVEHTEDRNSAKLVKTGSTVNDGYDSFGSKQYTDWFPGLNAKYEIDRNFLLRGAVTTSIGRPNYADLAPYVIVVDGSPASVALGNPSLKPYKALNLDASLEYYLPSQGVLSIGLFYKHIDNPIYTQTARMLNGTYAGVAYASADVSQPLNADDETVQGVEVNGQVQFTFLPSPFDGLGISANYTHVSGHASAPGLRAGDIPLFDQSHDIGNVQIFYEKYGFAARVAFSYRSAYLDALGKSAALDQYTDANGQIDVHASYQLLKQVTIFADGTNLTDAPWRRYIGNPGQLVERERYSFLLRGGVQVHF